jgi:hypothetical protein
MYVCMYVRMYVCNVCTYVCKDASNEIFACTDDDDVYEPYASDVHVSLYENVAVCVTSDTLPHSVLDTTILAPVRKRRCAHRTMHR